MAKSGAKGSSYDGMHSDLANGIRAASVVSRISCSPDVIIAGGAMCMRREEILKGIRAARKRAEEGLADLVRRQREMQSLVEDARDEIDPEKQQSRQFKLHQLYLGDDVDIPNAVRSFGFVRHVCADQIDRISSLVYRLAVAQGLRVSKPGFSFSTRDLPTILIASALEFTGGAYSACSDDDNSDATCVDCLSIVEDASIPSADVLVPDHVAYQASASAWKSDVVQVVCGPEDAIMSRYIAFVCFVCGCRPIT